MLAYAILLLIAGIVLALLEALIPSGGILGILSAAAIIGSLVLGFREGDSTGLVILTIVLIVVPIVVIIGLKLFPKTPLGRKVILEPVVEKPGERGKAGVSNEDRKSLLGQEGVTVTSLRPSGIAEIKGERYSVVAEGELIQPGTEIKVIRIEGNSIVVDPKEG